MVTVQDCLMVWGCFFAGISVLTAGYLAGRFERRGSR